MKPYLYLRGLRQMDHTVFSVENGQKTYWDPIFNNRLPYSSGQQVKRSILDAMVETMEDEKRAPITFNYQITSGKDGKDSLAQKEPWSPCDPLHADQLIGGWMRAQSSELTLKRRSPLSISAMRPLHPTLARTSEESLTFDRSENPSHNPVRVRNAEGELLSDEAVNEFLRSNTRSLPRRHWIPSDKVGSRAEGLFVYDVAIDLRRLFKVSTNRHDPELTEAKEAELREEGWIEKGEFLVCPADRREEIIPALAHALINWRITSNQSRTYSPQPTLAIAISDNANLLAAAIRADLREEGKKADPVLEKVRGAELYIALSAKGYVPGVMGSAEALANAEHDLTEQLKAFEYEV
ncbi:hypothetical protein SAMN05421823_1154 [Catalinimonas alkaloidigena]|uniref:CRISPR-associated protein Cas7 n=1 Tax=Catalinimonas alkaloidigena TaxID=1075417 RepID=A0A1G9TV77_9BACT|nr:CRISPR-associated protein Cas7 [Catalinimonas alkaloidigena]SDM51639.1 hypothetical protein SAMN05421823_1154 [Catalinimonas alkaloidigena]